MYPNKTLWMILYPKAAPSFTTDTWPYPPIIYPNICTSVHFHIGTNTSPQTPNYTVVYINTFPNLTDIYA